MVDAVDVALLQQHRLAVGRHQQRAEGVVAGVHRRLRHGVGAAQVAQHLLGRRLGHAQCPWLPRCAQAVVRFSITENSSYMAIAMMPTTTRPLKARPICMLLPALMSR